MLLARLVFTINTYSIRRNFREPVTQRAGTLAVLAGADLAGLAGWEAPGEDLLPVVVLVPCAVVLRSWPGAAGPARKRHDRPDDQAPEDERGEGAEPHPRWRIPGPRYHPMSPGLRAAGGSAPPPSSNSRRARPANSRRARPANSRRARPANSRRARPANSRRARPGTMGDKASVPGCRPPGYCRPGLSAPGIRCAWPRSAARRSPAAPPAREPIPG